MKATAKLGVSKKTQGGEIRKHYFLDHYVIISATRGKRPGAFSRDKTYPVGHSPALEKERSLFEIKNPDGDWAVKVIANAFPALTLENAEAYGEQEIVLETPFHNQPFSDLALTQIEKIFEAYKARVKTLSQIEGIAYVAVFKNDGPAAGATIAQAHSQIIALPLVPPVVETEAIASESYKLRHGTCPVCDVIAWEKMQKKRLIYEDDHLVAICPYAATWPFGVWIIPKHHKRAFADLNQTELHSFAQVLKQLTTQLDQHGISFNFFLQDSLPDQNHHFVLKLDPRPNVWAGLELSTGVIINPMPPEDAAAWYRKAA